MEFVVLGRNVRGYWEYFFQCGSTLTLPTKIPTRFLSRILHTCNNFYHVDSRFDANPQQVELKGLLHGAGVWLVKDDLYVKGGFLMLKPKRTFFGIDIHEDSALCVLDKIAELHYNNPSPSVFYHGTAVAHLQSILLSGLKPSDGGMLGAGFYVGTFWKAARFAIKSQTYEEQKGVVFRVLATVQHPIVFPRLSWKCLCEQCAQSPFSNIADHKGMWAAAGDAAVARATGEPCGTCRDGTPKYALRNEEWCLRDKPTIIQWAYLYPRLQTYDPLDRSIKID